MAGFRRKRKTYMLDFSDTEWDGLQVKVRGLTTGEYLQIVSLSGATDEDSKETELMLRMLSSHIVSWNLEDNGEPVGVSFEEIKENDFLMNMAIVNAWVAAISSVPEDVAKKSRTGNDSLVASIPTEML
jgi:hypothetical protein